MSQLNERRLEAEVKQLTEKLRAAEQNLKSQSSVDRDFCLSVFYYEGWLLWLSGALMLLTPWFIMEQQGFSQAACRDGIVVGNLRQFGAMCCLMGYGTS